MKFFLKIRIMMNSRIIRKLLIISVFIIIICSVLSGEDAEIVLDDKFFKDFSKIQIIQRDDHFQSLINNIVIGRGIITGISVNERYKKKFRLAVESSDSAAYNQKIIFFVFLENKDTVDLLNLNTKFEFKGQLMGFTPLNTKRSDYILDVVLMDGSTVIE